MIYQLLLIALIIEIVVAYRNPKYAVGICLANIVFFPNSIKFNVGVNLNSFNLSVICLSIPFMVYVLKNKCLFPDISKQIKFYVIYVAITSFLCALNSITFNEYVQNMILLVMEYGLLAYVMCWTRMNNKEIMVFDNILIIVGIIVILYSFTNYVLKYNPYLAYISMVTDVSDDMSNAFMEEQRGFLDGRVSSFFAHPLHLGQWIVMVFAYSYYELRDRIHPILYYFFIILLFVTAVLTGSRSSLFPLFIVIIFFVLHHNRRALFKYLLGGTLSIAIAYPLLPETVQDYVEATVLFWSDDASSKADIKGSSTELRFDQIETAVFAISDNPILGKGFNYSSKHGDDLPSGLYGLESIFLSHTINGGLLGLLVFLFFYFRLYLLLRKKSHTANDKAMVDSVCLSYFVSISLTGIVYSFFCMYLIFYMMTLYRITCNNYGKYKTII